jgi:hypothetical protein
LTNISLDSQEPGYGIRFRFDVEFIVQYYTLEIKMQGIAILERLGAANILIFVTIFCG